jgi:hypothetical protein
MALSLLAAALIMGSDRSGVGMDSPRQELNSLNCIYDAGRRVRRLLLLGSDYDSRRNFSCEAQ